MILNHICVTEYLATISNDPVYEDILQPTAKYANARSVNLS